jgi:hypothetical protein
MIFCPLEKVEINLDKCPIHRCIYQGHKGKCAYSTLTADNEEHVTAAVIAEVKDIKVHLVKEEATTARARLTLGMLIDKYAEYIILSFPSERRSTNTDSTLGEVVLKKDSEYPIAKLLKQVFMLTEEQQAVFWSKARFNSWCKRQSVTAELSDIFQVLQTLSHSN